MSGITNERQLLRSIKRLERIARECVAEGRLKRGPVITARCSRRKGEIQPVVTAVKAAA